MKRVRALTGSSRMPSRDGVTRRFALTAGILFLALALTAAAAPALAEGLSAADVATRLADELARQAELSDETDAITALALDGPVSSTPLPEGATLSVDVDPGSTVAFDLTVDADDIVAIRASATGGTSDSNDVVGRYDLKRGGQVVDTVRLLRGRTEDSWFPLPAGDYTVEFTPVGANLPRSLSIYWASQGLDLGGGQLTLPNNRSYDAALPIETNRMVHGVFYWGFNASSDESRLDGHYYEFRLDRRSAVTLALGSPGLSQIAMMSGENKVMDDANGVPVAASGIGSTSVDCGIFQPGTYRIFVASKDPASWKRHYVAQVFAYPVDSQLTVTENVYRLYNEWSGEHLFTADGSERDAIVAAGWKDEGIAWVAPSTSGDPVWRLCNPYTGEHLYTKDLNERATLIGAGWGDEGVGWYSDGEMGQPVYRLYNPYATEIAAHHYTTDGNEYRTLGDAGWRQEGERWYGLR